MTSDQYDDLVKDLSLVPNSGARSSAIATFIKALQASIHDINYVDVTVEAGATAGTTSATGVHAGFGGLGATLTPRHSGVVQITFKGNFYNNTASGAVTVLTRYGTGTAPTHGAAPTGTQIGVAQASSAQAANGVTAFTQVAIVTGLTVGTAYWFDCVYARVSAATTAFLYIVDAIILEL
jgi:hypothetical protein